MKRTPRPAKKTPPVPREPPPESIAPRLVFAAILVAMPFVPGHPLEFLPPLLFWPACLGAACVVAWPSVRLLRPGIPELRGAAWVCEAAALVLLFGSFGLLKLAGLHASGTDDNIYFYMAVRFAEGAVPYRDFFFAHPPMHLLVPALLFKVFGFSIGLAKAIPALAQAVAGVFLYLAVRRASRPMAVGVLLLHLTAYQVLMGSTDMNGENLMTAFWTAGLWALVSARPLASGILAAAALSCGLYAMAAVLAIAVAASFAGARVRNRWFLGFSAGLAVINLPFLILGGSGYYDGVIAYHLAKPVKGGARWPVFDSLNPFSVGRALFHNLAVWLGSDEFRKSLYYHAPAYVAGLLGVGILGGRALGAWWSASAQDRRPGVGWTSHLSPRDLAAATPEGLTKLAVLACVLFQFQWAALAEIYDFYLVPMIAFLAIPAGFAITRVLERARRAGRWQALPVPVALAALFSLHVPWAASLGRSLWPEESRAAGEVVTYDWRDPDVLAGPAQLTRALFFHDSRRKGEVTPYYRHYLWNKRLTFSTAQEIADYVRANTSEEETLTGASTLAPLVALLAGRRLASDEADTNAKRFKSGQWTEQAFLEQVCSDRVRFIVSAPRSYFEEKRMTSWPAIGRWFEKDRTFVDQKLQHFRGFPITLYRRLDRPGLPDGRVCEP